MLALVVSADTSIAANLADAVLVLLGAGVGAGASILGGYLGVRWQARASEEVAFRIRQRERQDEALTELLTMAPEVKDAAYRCFDRYDVAEDWKRDEYNSDPWMVQGLFGAWGPLQGTWDDRLHLHVDDPRVVLDMNRLKIAFSDLPPDFEQWTKDGLADIHNAANGLNRPGFIGGSAV